jgi:hypothetical protein
MDFKRKHGTPLQFLLLGSIGLYAHQVHKFDFSHDKMILGKADALKEFVVGGDTDDVINDVSDHVFRVLDPVAELRLSSA